MENMFPVLIGLAATIFIVAILVVFITRDSKKHSKKTKSRTAIIKEATRKLAQDSHNTSGLIPLANLYFSEKDWKKAFPLYSTLNTIAGAHPEVNVEEVALRMGICAVHLEDYKNAFIGLSAAYKINPAGFDVNYYLGKACYKTNTFDKAITCFKKALIANPDATTIQGPLGLAFYRTKKYKMALKYLRSALNAEPNNKELLFALAESMFESGYTDNALKIFIHLRADPEYGAKSCLNAGIIHFKKQKIDESISDFEIGLKLENTPQDIILELQYRLANAYISKSDITKALDFLKRIQVVLPSYKDVGALIIRYQELAKNKNLQLYLISSNSDFVALCRRIVASFYTNSFVKILDVSVATGSIEITCNVENSRWEGTEIFRFYRSAGAVGELYIRDFNAKIKDSKCDKGRCLTAGLFSPEARKFAEGRPIDLYDKKMLIEILKKVS